MPRPTERQRACCFYCCTAHALLKILQIIFATLILPLLLWEGVTTAEEVDQIHTKLIRGEEATCVICCIAIVANTIILILEGLSCKIACGRCTTRYTIHLYYLALLMAFVGVASYELYVTLTHKSDTHAYGRRAAATAFCYTEVLLFALCLWTGTTDYIRIRMNE